MGEYRVTARAARLDPPVRMVALLKLDDNSTTVWGDAEATCMDLSVDAGAPDVAAAEALLDVSGADPEYRPQATRVACRRCARRLAEEFLITDPAADRLWEALAKLLLSAWQRKQADGVAGIERGAAGDEVVASQKGGRDAYGRARATHGGTA